MRKQKRNDTKYEKQKRCRQEDSSRVMACSNVCMGSTVIARSNVSVGSTVIACSNVSMGSIVIACSNISMGSTVIACLNVSMGSTVIACLNVSMGSTKKGICLAGLHFVNRSENTQHWTGTCRLFHKCNAAQRIVNCENNTILFTESKIHRQKYETCISL